VLKQFQVQVCSHARLFATPWTIAHQPPQGLLRKESACNTGDVVQLLGQEDPLEEEMAPVFLLENPINRGGWWAIVHGVAKSRA